MKKINSLAMVHSIKDGYFTTNATREEMKEIRSNAKAVNEKLKYKFEKTLKDFDWDYPKFLEAFIKFEENIPSNEVS